MSDEKKIILIVDDSEMNRAVLMTAFDDEYDFIEAEDGLDGLQKLTQNSDRICAVLLDIIMPVMDGITFLQKMKETGLQKQIPVFVVTADQSTPSVMEAYKLGAMDVIAKPAMPFVIKRRVNSIIELFSARKQLSSEVLAQQKRLLEQQQQIIELNNGLTEALFAAIEFRSGETGRHVRRIRFITETLLEKTELGKGISQAERTSISIAAMLHDIGKISIPDAVLNKPGRFTDEERKLMQTHTTLGVQFLNKIPQLKNHAIYPYAADIILHHHERWDGKGYPDGLKGDEISTAAQLVSIADVYEALLSKRVYKDPYTRETALEMISSGKCGTFSPKLLDAFFKCEPILYEAMFSMA